MSDTTGWKRDDDGDYNKDTGFPTVIFKDGDGAWCLRMFATRPTLRECQVLAHATARLWAGEEE